MIHLKDVTPEQASHFEEQLTRIVNDDRYPPRLKIWMVLTALRTVEIDPDQTEY